MFGLCCQFIASSLLLTPVNIPDVDPGIRGSVVQIRMPAETVTLYYIEARDCFTVGMRSKTASVEGTKFYVGDGNVAVELLADPSRGIYFQGKPIDQGFQFVKDSTVKVLPGFKKAHELVKGDIYVVLSGVIFDAPLDNVKRK